MKQGIILHFDKERLGSGQFSISSARGADRGMMSLRIASFISLSALLGHSAISW